MTDEKLILFCQEFRDGILAGDPSDGYCWMISGPLAPLLERMGVANTLRETKRVRIYTGDLKGCTTSHYWIELADGRALDCTVDQFDPKLPLVYLGKPMKRFHRREGGH